MSLQRWWMFNPPSIAVHTLCQCFKIRSWPFEELLLNPLNPLLWSSWGVPLAITVAAVCLNKIGYDASEVSVGWCWVRIHAPDRVLWMLLTGKIWEFLAYLTLPVLYILIKRHIHIAVRIHGLCADYIHCSYHSHLLRHEHWKTKEASLIHWKCWIMLILNKQY